MTKHLFFIPLFVMSLAIPGHAATTSLVPTNSQWKYILGTAEASNPITAWRQISFNDASWLTGTMPMGYGDSDGLFPVTVLPTSTVGNYVSAYFRKSFTVSNPNQYSEVTLNVIVDDGAVAFLNGVELGRVNVPPGELFFNDVAPSAAETTTINAVTNKAVLVAGNNVLAIHAFNANLTSSDFLVHVGLTATTDDIPPTVVEILPPPTATVPELFQIEVFFSEAVTNVDAADLLINNVPATGVIFGGPDQVLFEFTQPPNGPVTVMWANGHGITDLASSPNAFAGGTFTYTLDPNAMPAGIIINEFLASNDGDYHDEDGDSSDWIEIVNAGSISGNLNGWFLTDETNNLTKWRIPNVTLLPNEFLVVFASGKNRTNTSSRLHANFQLNTEGEFLALVDTQTNIISQFFPKYPVQSTDVSYGRDRANPTVSGYFAVPTPGLPNSATGAGFSPDIQFSRASGTFVNAFNLVLSSPSPNAVIRYTTTTNMPTELSTIYTTPIPINSSTIIRARAFEPGLFPSQPRSEHYARLDTAVAGVTSDLPLMILNNYGLGAVPASGEQFVNMQIYEPKNGRSSLTNAPDLSTRGRFRLRGSSTQGYAKGSFAFEAWDEFSNDKEISPLGMPAESDWVLYAPNNFDAAVFHNPLAYQLSRDMGRYATRTRFVEVYLKDDAGVPGSIVAGDYNGIYVFTEEIKIDNDRVDIDRLEPENLTAPTVTGGYLFKIDRVDPGDAPFTGAGQSINYVDPKGEMIRLPQRDAQEQYVLSYFAQFNTALNGANYRDPTNGYAKFIERDAAIDHHIHNVVTFNVDALRLSGFFYKTRDAFNDLGQLIAGKIVFGPVWDFDRTQGSRDGRDFNPTVWRSTVPDNGTDFFNYPWWGRMFTDPDFWQTWIDRYENFRQGALSTNNIFARIDSLANELRESQPRDAVRFPQGSSPRTGVNSAGGYSYNFGTGRGYDAEIDWKKEWYRARLAFIDNQFLNRPLFSHAGGPVSPGFILSISGPPGATIYYTLNGTDPRAFGGGIAPGALTYSGPIQINANARVVARSRDLAHSNLTGPNNPPISSPWSGSVAATFVISTPTLIVSEIMYHPRPAPPGNTNDANNFEFIELKNIGIGAINLVGFRLTNGIEFNFTSASLIQMLNPGASVVLVKNITAFTSRYPGVSNIGGQFLGNLDNAGEQITLLGPLEEPILDFAYDDDWYPVTDGSGFSLVVVNENAPLSSWALKTNWRVSSSVNGSPGTDDPAPPNIPAVVINEALTHTDVPVVDAIEIHNPTAALANIGGWYLTDNFDTPQKYRIPDGTTVPANGFLVFYESNSFNANPGLPNNFSFSSKGDAAYIFSGNGTDLSGYAHGFDFGAAPNGVTFGRHIISTGGDQFPAQISPSLGSGNAGPRVGPVVVSEIMYHPVDLAGGLDDTDNEYIELQNITGSPVALFDTTNTWHLSNAVDFEFPPNTTLAANGRLLITRFDPVTNATQLAAFRTRNGVSNDVPVFGPFRGQLDNSSDAVELLRPDSPEPPGSPDAGFIPYVLVERVRYSDQDPWPVAADGIGPSLHRINTSGYGNDPINWVSAARTPGQPYGGGTPPVIVAHPTNRTIIAFNNVSFAVTVSGTGPFSYQWRFNGSTLPGATEPTLILNNVQASQAGQYQVVVLNSANAVASSNATLTVLVPANIVQQPQSLSVRPGTNITFVVVATSGSPITYQWRKNGIPIAGATTTVLAINNVQTPDAANYDVVLTDAVGPVVSATAKLTVLVNPTIVVQPVNQTNMVGATASFSVQSTGTLPMGYRWRRGGSTVLNQVINSHVSFLNLTNVQLSQAGNYTVVLTNEANPTPGLLSQIATNTVIAAMDADGDGIPDEYEADNGLNPNSAADAGLDKDGDGVSNRDEYIAGTDPQNAQSYLKVESITATGGVNIRFNAAANKSYAVQYRDGIPGGTWQLLAGVPLTLSARSVTVTDPSPPSPGERYYRLVTPGTTVQP